MIIYNVTCNMEEKLVPTWLEWMKTHIPEVLGTGCFLEARLTRVLVEEQDGSATFSVQYKAPDRAALQHYYDSFADGMRQESQRLFGNQVYAFRTELEVLDEYRAST